MFLPPIDIRAVVRLARGYFLYLFGFTTWAKWRLRKQGSVVVLTFHRILANSDLARANSLEGIVVRARSFDLLTHFLQRHCQFVDLSYGMPSWQQTDRPRVAITFDDGWRDNATTAYPVARRYALPVSIFICPGLMGQEQPFWPERAVRSLKAACRPGEGRRPLRLLLSGLPGGTSVPEEGPLSEATLEAVIDALKAVHPDERDEILEKLSALAPPDDRCSFDATMAWPDFENLRSGGVAFGSHTQTHQILTELPPAAVRAELQDSKAAIERRLGGAPCLLLAYPNGSVSDSVRQQAALAGYALAFTTESGTWNDSTDPLRIPRVNVWEGKLAGARGRFSRAIAEYWIFWRPYRSRKHNRFPSGNRTTHEVMEHATP